MIKFFDILRLVFFSAFTVFWCVLLITNPDNRVHDGLLFLAHIFVVAFLLYDFLNKIIKK
jgi:hypothetical protein